MNAAVKTRIVKIGNSQGVRIPRPVLEQAGLSADVEISVEGRSLVIRSARRARSGWEESFAATTPSPMDEYPPTDFDLNEWDWK